MSSAGTGSKASIASTEVAFGNSVDGVAEEKILSANDKEVDRVLDQIVVDAKPHVLEVRR